MTWMQTRSGIAIDPAKPDLTGISIEVDIAIPMSLINRFNGHTAKLENAGYSVAQHNCLGADAVLQETGGDTDAALAFLLHNAHQFLIGDFTTPVVAGLDRLAVDILGRPANGMIRRAVKAMKAGVDAEIYRVLGLEWPLSPHIADIVADMDLRMLRRERDELMAAPPKPWDRSVETAGPIPSLEWRDFLGWRPPVAVNCWMERFSTWHPQSTGAHQFRKAAPWLSRS